MECNIHSVEFGRDIFFVFFRKLPWRSLEFSSVELEALEYFRQNHMNLGNSVIFVIAFGIDDKTRIVSKIASS